MTHYPSEFSSKPIHEVLKQQAATRSTARFTLYSCETRGKPGQAEVSSRYPKPHIPRYLEPLHVVNLGEI
jgi:hypothetical protein